MIILESLDCIQHRSSPYNTNNIIMIIWESLDCIQRALDLWTSYRVLDCMIIALGLLIESNIYGNGNA